MWRFCFDSGSYWIESYSVVCQGLPKTSFLQLSEVFDPDKFRNPEYYSPERRNKEAFGLRNEEHLARFKKELGDIGATLYASEEEMAGKERFVVDDLLSADQCEVLRDLAKFGYGGREIGSLRENIKHEIYDGLKVDAIKEMIENHTIDVSVAELYFGTIDKMKKIISSYFNLKWPLYIDFVHTACKNPVVFKNGEPRSDYYQKIHTDNCKYRKGKRCEREYPARFWREFTSLIYLNEADGGEFVFADENENILHKVSPKCGRMLTFNSTYPHGVLGYKNTSRCVIGVWTTLDPNRHDKQVDQAKASISTVKQLNDNRPLKEFIEERGIKLNLTEEELNGPERFAVDNVITQDECDALIHLANIGGVAGDGYSSSGLTSVNTENERFAGLTVAKAAEDGGIRGDGYLNSGGSPHTVNEMFEGLGLLRAAKLAAQGKLKSEWVKLYMEKSKLVKDIVEKYFKLKSPLYFDYTHLVCRTSMHEKNKIRTDFSHPIHSDNCIIQSDNSCKKAPPAYVQRDYSALLYLNDNFTGGEFIFTHQNMTVQSMVKPWCGFAMAFNAGNYHGVHAVTSGQRCALAAWYTLDKRFDETAHTIAKNIMKDLEGKPLGPPASSRMHGDL
ncbi:hypothetical protein LSH36_231g04011 [Paralvinella palmiformis]|uniref:procollagen-proline 3-dioxygenase n=1 Tax=Paralvinella palmiformis TaxID=53620 RepID=A0AAD9N3I0_9ANNE|nr:hypothetical protein LSH36_231g04011 [Paralvinella palmiformis]